MRVMWIVNKSLVKNTADSFGGGWLNSLLDNLKFKEDITLTVCYTDRGLKSLKKEEVDGVLHVGIPRKKSVLKYDASLKKYFENIIDEFKPDLIHIQGTENAAGIVAMRARPNYKYIVSIQGLLSRYSEHYSNGIPFPFFLDLTLRDFFHKDGPLSKGKKFKKSSWYEIEMIKKANYIMARTSWDTACVRHINRHAKIYSDLRVLRPTFYEKEWSLEKCERHSIFVGNSKNSIKGFHYILRALPLIKKIYPDVRVYVAGPNNIDDTKCNFFKRILSKQTYDLYLHKLMKKYKLQHNVIFTGVLDEKHMCEYFLKANVFILPSIIENSPNTLSEAAVLGVPIISSYVAGVPDLVEDQINGFLYSYDEYYIMADRVLTLFENDNLAVNFSKSIKEKSRVMYNPEKNTNLVYFAYKDILNNDSKK